MSQFSFRSRQDTSADLSREEIFGLLETHWGYHVVEIERANSRCVYFIDLPQERLIFRANPGWDGPLPLFFVL